MIYETIITTVDKNSNWHVAPMGIEIINEDVILKPFKPSKTLENIIKTKKAVLNITDDVSVFAGCVTGRKNFEVVPIENKIGYRLNRVLSHSLLSLINVSDNDSRPKLRMKKENEVFHSNFKGINRAQAAIVEASILVSRVKIIPIEKILREMSYLEIAISKTAGSQEKKAWSWLTEEVEKNISLSNKIKNTKK